MSKNILLLEKKGYVCEEGGVYKIREKSNSTSGEFPSDKTFVFIEIFRIAAPNSIPSRR